MKNLFKESNLKSNQEISSRENCLENEVSLIFEEEFKSNDFFPLYQKKKEFKNFSSEKIPKKANHKILKSEIYDEEDYFTSNDTDLQEILNEIQQEVYDDYQSNISDLNLTNVYFQDPFEIYNTLVDNDNFNQTIAFNDDLIEKKISNFDNITFLSGIFFFLSFFS